MTTGNPAGPPGVGGPERVANPVPGGAPGHVTSDPAEIAARVVSLEGARARSEFALERATSELARSRDERNRLAANLREQRARYDRLAGRRVVKLAVRIADRARSLPGGRRRNDPPGPVDTPPAATTGLTAPPPVERGGSGADGSTATLTPPRLLADPEVTGPGEEAGRSGRAATTDVPLPTVLIPVYNAADELRAAIDSIFRNTPAAVPILIIDDASPDPAIGTYLAEIAASDNVTVLRNERNLGFSGTVNRGFAVAEGDVVLLNSDVEVTPRWLDNLTFAAHRSPEIATASPLSDNAGAFAVPEVGRANPVPGHLDRDQVGRLFSQRSLRLYPDTPTTHGFCMYVKRAALDDIGVFDAEAFPRGYGEENDFCMRAMAEGWRHVVDDATLVFHARGASFGEDRTALMESARQVLETRHPTFASLARDFVHGPEMSRIRAHVADVFATATGRGVVPRRRVLYLVHEGTGGTPASTFELMAAVDTDIEPMLLVSDRRALCLYRIDGSHTELVEAFDVEETLWASQAANQRYRDFLTRVMMEHTIELVHIRHLLKHTLDAPAVAHTLGIPVVLSFHDFYYICPTVHLIDNNGKWCRGVCTPGDGVCVPADGVRNLPHLKHQWVYEWRELVRPMFDHVDCFVTATTSVRQVYLEMFPALADRDFEVIEHGRDLAQHSDVAEEPEPGGPIRIVLLGNLSVQKGGELAEAIAAADVTGRIEFHILGSSRPRFQNLGVFHGPYRRNELAERLAAIRPHFVGLLSVTAETYSHTLSEAWACGVPVIATDLGALGERVRAHGGGWLIDPGDPPAALATILAAADDIESYRMRRAEATIEALSSTAEMASGYLDLYDRILRRRSERAPTGPALSS